MIHNNACHDRDKYCAMLWPSGNYCGLVDLDNPQAHQAIDFKKLSAHPGVVKYSQRKTGEYHGSMMITMCVCVCGKVESEK